MSPSGDHPSVRCASRRCSLSCVRRAVGVARASAQDVGTEAQRESGKKLYPKYCSQCHGEKGDGEGYAAPHLRPGPRNFTTGKFKVRTTPNGALPTHQDLVNIIRRGMPYTSMPAWPNLSDQEVSDLAYFITTFSADFANAEQRSQGRRSRARRARRTSPSSRARSCSRTPAASMPRHARTRRRTVGSDAEGRLGPSDPRRPTCRRAGRSGAARRARTSSGR